MKNRCQCYHTQKKLRYTYNPITGSPIPHDIEVGVCWGTKETDECSCGGDETQCDFYPEIREKARKELDVDADIVKVVRCKNCKHGRSIDKTKAPEKYFRDDVVICECEDTVGDEPTVYPGYHFCSYGKK